RRVSVKRGGRGLKRMRLVIASVPFVFDGAANPPSVSGRVTGPVGEAVAGAGQAGARLSGSQAPSSSNSSNSSLLGGELPAGVKMKLGDKVINLRGNVGVGDNGGNFTDRGGLSFSKEKRARQNGGSPRKRPPLARNEES